MSTRLNDPRRARLVSWGLSGVWLVFLAFPLVSLLQSPLRVAVPAITLLVVFVAVYLWMLRLLGVFLPPEARPLQVRLFIALLVVTGLSMVVEPMMGLAYLPYLVAAGGFGLWVPVNRRVAAATLLVGAAIAFATDPSRPDNSMVAVGALNLFISWVVTASIVRGDIDRSMREELRLVEERNRIASDVHDLLGHSLTVVNLKLQLIERLVPTDPERAVAELDETRAIVAEALGNVRRTVSMERSSTLSDALEAARTSLAAGGVELRVEGDPDVVQGPIALVLGWVVREASTNVLRHAHAEQCRVTIDPHRLVIADDGDGRCDKRDGNGIRGMRERVAAAGGALEVGTSELGGTSVEVTW